MKYTLAGNNVKIIICTRKGKKISSRPKTSRLKCSRKSRG